MGEWVDDGGMDGWANMASQVAPCELRSDVPEERVAKLVVSFTSVSTIRNRFQHVGGLTVGLLLRPHVHYMALHLAANKANHVREP